ncbi:MAG: nucleotide sugar dehydrogenase [Candidatus Aenigmarchaeota archaeon]|nr:nucleotide sugar dehydrogenase [Candidatus Aenigmarchaeota archaeon]
MARIGIVGSGVVGYIIGRGFEKIGNDVIFYDTDKKRVKKLKDERLKATTDIRDLVNSTDIAFISVPTPTKKGKIDLSYIKDACKNLAKALKEIKRYYLVVIKSTVIPLTTEKVVIPILEKYSRKKVGKDFGVCVNPEFLTEIARSWTNDALFKRDFFSEDRIVIGEFDRKSGEVLKKIYKPLKIPVFNVDLKTAEMIKYASNCMLATKISYWNEIFLICKELGINSKIVADIAALDPRIGKYGSVHGLAFGGKCLEKDLFAFIQFVKKYHYPELLEAVLKINLHMAKKYGVRE